MLPPKILLLQVSGLDIETQLQIEEAFLRVSDQNLCLINSSPPPAIVLGISSDIDEVLFKETVISDNLTVIRRFSGGGTVFINDDVIMVSWICSTETSSLINPQELMALTKQLYAKTFPPDFDVRNNDYVIGHKKIGGNAQYIQKKRWVHHSSFLWDTNIKLMNRYLKIPPKQPEYRNNRTHEEFLVPLKNFYSQPSVFLERLLSDLREHQTFLSIELEEIISIINRPHRRSTAKIHFNRQPD
ncbi:MAG: lipoate--protein ligase family protein [Victivallaceae bacterium]